MRGPLRTCEHPVLVSGFSEKNACTVWVVVRLSRIHHAFEFLSLISFQVAVHQRYATHEKHMSKKMPDEGSTQSVE